MSALRGSPTNPGNDVPVRPRAKANLDAEPLPRFLLGGVAHFVLTRTEMRIVPPWIPWPHAVVLVSGVFELLGAAGLLWRRTRFAAGIGLFLLTLAVTPAHFYMLRQPELFDVPYWALILRLPLQAALLALIAWTTWKRNPRRVTAESTDGDRLVPRNPD
jgi:uncharacterized membrane protein